MKENPVVQFIQAVARPAISIIFAAGIVDLVVSEVTPPEWFLALAIPTIVWWFGERARTHKVEQDYQKKMLEIMEIQAKK